MYQATRSNSYANGDCVEAGSSTSAASAKPHSQLRTPETTVASVSLPSPMSPTTSTSRNPLRAAYNAAMSTLDNAVTAVLPKDQGVRSVVETGALVGAGLAGLALLGTAGSGGYVANMGQAIFGLVLTVLGLGGTAAVFYNKPD